MLHADYLFLLTDVDSLYTANPRKDPSAHAIEIVESVSTIRTQGIHWSLSPIHTPLTPLDISS
jgi:glutamate 5-kinase